MQERGCFVDPISGVSFHHAPPWDRSEMTVCIATVCGGSLHPTIVLCSDWKGSSPLGTSETFLKQRRLASNWFCQMSGSEADTLALFRIMRGIFKEEKNVDDANITTIIRKGLATRKLERANEYTYGKFALSYDDFIKIGKEKLPPEIFRDAWVEISNISLRAELLISGFSNNLPYICQTTDSGQVSLRENFCTIGEGAFLASSVMYHRQIMDYSDFERALYAVFEAKKYAERIASVGTTTALCILEPHEGHIKPRYISEKGLDVLEDEYKKRGPKPLGNLQLDKDELFEDE